MVSISIIVPVYKVEAYLQRCIDSVLTQDFQDWEMILVDDGSPDRCPQICDEAAKKDERISVVHKENGGALAARYEGYKISHGEYLVFLDSDDWLLEGALTTLYEGITSDEGYDIVKSLVFRKDKKGKEWIEHYALEKETLDDKDAILNAIFSGKVSPYIHSGIYRKELFCDEFFLQVIKSGLVIGEDWVMNVLISPNVYKMKNISIPTYAYYWNDTSMMTSTIRTPRYPAIVEQALGDFFIHAPAHIAKQFEVMKMTNYVMSFFRPEIPFSTNLYKLVIRFLNCDNNYASIKNSISNKYIIGIKCKLFYYTYTWFYRQIYYNIKLKRHFRKITPA